MGLLLVKLGYLMKVKQWSWLISGYKGMFPVCLACFGYRVGKEAVEIHFLGIRVRKLSFSNIEEVWLGSKGSVGEVWTLFKWWGWS